jgi:hypothetical protein
MAAACRHAFFRNPVSSAQDRRRLAHPPGHVPGQRVPVGALVPRREAEQPLHPVQLHVPGELRQPPRALPLLVRQQPQHTPLPVPPDRRVLKDARRCSANVSRLISAKIWRILVIDEVTPSRRQGVLYAERGLEWRFLSTRTRRIGEVRPPTAVLLAMWEPGYGRVAVSGRGRAHT